LPPVAGRQPGDSTPDAYLSCIALHATFPKDAGIGAIGRFRPDRSGGSSRELIRLMRKALSPFVREIKDFREIKA